jgi:hypothetical protein
VGLFLASFQSIRDCGSCMPIASCFILIFFIDLWSTTSFLEPYPPYLESTVCRICTNCISVCYACTDYSRYLRGNKFIGNVPNSLCALAYLNELYDCLVEFFKLPPGILAIIICRECFKIPAPNYPSPHSKLPIFLTITSLTFIRINFLVL